MKTVLAVFAVAALAGPAFAQADHNMATMGHAAMAADAQGTGIIKKLDLKAGSVTMQHGPIAALKWPAMTMAFKADAALMKTVKVGQKVNFTIKPGATPEVIAFKPVG